MPSAGVSSIDTHLRRGASAVYGFYRGGIMRLNLILLSLLISASTQAANVTWTVDLQFTDGGVGSGTFDYDAATNTYSNINVAVVGGDPSANVSTDLWPTYPDFVFDQKWIADPASVTYGSLYGNSTNSSAAFRLSPNLAFRSVFGWYDDLHLILNFGSPLSDSGGEIPITLSTGCYLAECPLTAMYRETWYGGLGYVPLQFRSISTGSVSASIVPIPAAVWLFASGVGLLGWMRRSQAA